jgi:hypothetical protein
MATTTNYGWTTPDDTGLVKDGASAIRSLGTSVDTTTKNLNPSTTLGDIEYRSSTANTNTRLGIGSTGNVLTVAGGVPTWAAPGATGSNWSLLNTGGTTLSGAATITVSGISSKNRIMVLIRGASAANTGVSLSLRFNSDSAGNYNPYGASYGFDTTYVASNFSGLDGTGSTEIPLMYFAGAHTATTSGYILLDGANASGAKIFTTQFGTSGTSKINYAVGGFYSGTSTISSVSILTDNGNFDGGTIYVYTTA